MERPYTFDYTIFDETYLLPIFEGTNRTREQLLLIATIHFAKNGYAAVTMRDIARIAGIQQSSIYNHFESKEALWKEVLNHAKSLYLLYFDELERELGKADSFEAMLELLFHEPKMMRNLFTCYAFAMIQAEQFRDEEAGRIYCETFLDYSIDFIRGWFDKCVAGGMVAAFDTGTVAAIIMYSILANIGVTVHRQNQAFLPSLSGASTSNPSAMLANVQRFILQAVSGGGPDTP